jgi:multicomponent Na+:H+ antiporter subunit B
MNRLLAALVPLGIVVLLSFFLFTGETRDQMFRGRSALGDSFSRRDVRSASPALLGPGSRGLENASANTVTAIVLDYRGFDTLGEVTVLFAAVAGAGLALFGRRRRRRTARVTRPSLILTAAAPWVFLFLFVVGFAIMLHGHLTPGGGFPGGALLAAGLVLLMAAAGHESSERRLHWFEGISGFSFVAVGLAGLFWKDSFLAHFGDAGALGAFWSAPVTILLYLIIGLKVAAELTGAVRTLAHVEDPTTEEAP